MGMIKIRAKATGGFTLITPGTYDLEIVEVKDDGEESRDGDPQVKVEFVVVDGDFAGKGFPKWYTINDKWGWQLRRLAQAAGLELALDGQADENGLLDFEINSDDLLGKIVRGDVTHYSPAGSDKTFHNLDKEAPSPLQNVQKVQEEPEVDDKVDEAPPPRRRRVE